MGWLPGTPIVLEAKMGWFERSQSIFEAKMDRRGVDSAVLDTELGSILATLVGKERFREAMKNPETRWLDFWVVRQLAVNSQTEFPMSLQDPF